MSFTYPMPSEIRDKILAHQVKMEQVVYEAIKAALDRWAENPTSLSTFVNFVPSATLPRDSLGGLLVRQRDELVNLGYQADFERVEQGRNEGWMYVMKIWLVLD